MRPLHRASLLLVLVVCACGSSSDPAVPAATGGAGSSAAGSSNGGASTAGAAGNASVAGQGGGSAGTTSGAGAAGAGSAGIGGVGDVCAVAGPAAVPATAPKLELGSEADTVALFHLSDTADSGTQALALTNNGGVAFTGQDLEWSEFSGDQVARFDGTDKSLTRAALTVGQDFTVEARVFWRGFKNRACGALTRIVSLQSGSSGISFEQPCGMAQGPRVRAEGSTDLAGSALFEDVQDNAWHWVRLVIEAGKASFYLDGAALGSSATLTGLGTATWTLTLGQNFNGDIDEVRLSNTAHTETAAVPTIVARPAYRELTLAAASTQLQVTSSLPNVVWSKLSGPGNVVFSDPTATKPTVTFCAPGKYVLSVLASAGNTLVGDTVLVRVWPAAGRDVPYKVLFIGNSFSFYNGTVGYRFWEYEKQAGENVGTTYAASPLVKMMTSPGMNFQYHWYQNNSNSECTNCPDHVLPAPPTVNLTDFVGKNAQDVVQSGGWDVVFLHSESTAAATDTVNFFRYGKKLDRLIKRSGARSVFYQTWAYPGLPNAVNSMPQEDTILGNYEMLASQTGAAISKVGRAFKDARTELNGYAASPNGILYTDAKHPGSFGTYLAAATHYGTVFGKSPVDVQLYPGAGDISTPLISDNKTKADQLRAIAARYASKSPLQNAE